jgi:cold shock CspA family protein
MQADRGGSEAPRNFADLDRGGRSGGKGGRGGGKGGGRAGGLPTGGRFGDGNESAGYITTLKENFGFIERARDAAGASGAGENIFFHFSAVCGGAGPSIGDEVSFTVAADRRTGRDAATLVTLLPKGTLPPPPRGGGLPREQGMVISLKDKFGFIRSETVPGQLFFHFSEAPRDEKGGKAEAAGDSGGKADGAGRGKAPLRVGDEVSFIRVTDAQSQKMAGTKLAALPPGTVRFETIEEAVMRGVVTRAAPGADRQTRMLSRRDKAQQGGLIRLLGEPCTDAAAGGVGVGTQAVDGGDAVHGASSQEGGRVGGASTVDDATAEEAVEAVEALSVTDGAAGAGGQVPGADAAAVASGRGGRGSASLCFGLDDVDDGCGELCVGDEVTFRRAIDRATGEVGAAHVVLVTAQWRRGFVTSFREGEGGMVRPSAGGASLPFDHHVSTLHGPSEGEPQGMHDTHESAPSDLRAVGDGDLRVGSEVEYRRSSDSRTKRACATCVWRLPPGSIVLEWVWPVRWEAELVSAPPRGAQPAGRKGQQGGGGQAVGLVQLKRPWRPEGHVGGAEIGASAGGEEAVQGGEAAQGVEAAEASGRIQLEMGQFCVPAALTAGTRASGGSGDAAFGSGGAAGGHGATQETSGGGVRAKPEAAALRAIASLAAGCVVAPLPLPLSVLADSRTTLNTGDTLSVQIAISASDGALRLCRAALLASAPGAYERGMVTNAKHDYGFLRAEGRAGVVFFHFSELPTRTHQVRHSTPATVAPRVCNCR